LNLASVRQGKGVSLEEIAHYTNIGLRFLEAIETEDFAGLPGGLYSRSYIRQYAQAIGYDASVVLERYREKMQPEPQVTLAAPHRGVSWWYRRLHQALQSVSTI
jgi:cytoskeletal protein RodZ